MSAGDPAGQIDAVDGGKPDVDQDDVRVQLGDHLEGRLPSAASPTTVNPLASSRMRRVPVRRSSWSSTTTTRRIWETRWTSAGGRLAEEPSGPSGSAMLMVHRRVVTRPR